MTTKSHLDKLVKEAYTDDNSVPPARSSRRLLKPSGVPPLKIEQTATESSI